MTTRWQQCPACKGLGNNCDRSGCGRCNDTFCIPIDTEQIVPLSEEELCVPDDLREWYEDSTGATKE